MRRVDREIMWGNTKKSGIYTTHPKHFLENFRGTDWHWYDVNDCWCFADEWLGKPVKVDVYGAGDEAEFVLNGKSLGRKPIEKLMASMDIPYEPGILEGVVYKDGAKISRSTLVTPKEAAVLELVPHLLYIHGVACYKVFQFSHIFLGGNGAFRYIGKSLFPACRQLRIQK